MPKSKHPPIVADSTGPSTTQALRVEAPTPEENEACTHQVELMALAAIMGPEPVYVTSGDYARGCLAYVSPNALQEMGLQVQVGDTITQVAEQTIHPQDQPLLLGIMVKAQELLNELPLDLRPQVRHVTTYRQWNTRNQEWQWFRVVQRAMLINAEGQTVRDAIFHYRIDEEKRDQRVEWAMYVPQPDGTLEDWGGVQSHLRVKGVVSAREHALLRGLADGLSSKELAANLGLSKPTMDATRKDLLRRFDVSNTPALVSYAYRYGLV